jgi:hypothetical protein
MSLNWLTEIQRIFKQMRVLGPKLSSQSFNIFGVKAAETEITEASETYYRG